MTLLTKDLIISQLESTEDFPIALSEVWEWLGYPRKDHAVRSFKDLEMAESIDFIQFPNSGENSLKASNEIKMTVDCFKLWAMSARTKKGKEVRLYYLQVEKDWKAQRSLIPQVSIEQIEAFQFQKNVFSPWIQDHPVAGDVFLSWQYVKIPLAIEHFQTASVPNTDSLLKLIDTLSLTANRAGLAGNKSTKEAEFLDKQLDKIRPQILALQADRDRLQAEKDKFYDILKITFRIGLRHKTKNDWLFSTIKKYNQSFWRNIDSKTSKTELLKIMRTYEQFIDNMLTLYTQKTPID